ncbi:probable cytochrome P450 12e1, mitochondrial isoform X2 [Drosophila miranda]|uniref:probable cytochrome P450 12e1, mitochondrial isoform X2 n=1 Tax=Drosophila miranda TaxID=7229 RepID=UPI00143F8F2C|nr:probable cytochrome P450 12e1, mitochondrial isoform X2 [Drosophila miranda]
MLSQQLNAKRQASWQIYQIYRNVASKTSLAQETISLEQAKPYAEVPGPSKFQMIRAFMPGGRYKNAPAHEMFLDLSRQFGSLFRMPSIAGNDIVLTMNPQDYATVFRNEGQWPYRRSFTTVEYFRKVRRPEVFGEYDGLLAGNGAAWGKMRTAVNPILLQPRNAKLYLKNLVQVSDEFLERIRLIRDPVSQEMPDDFTEDIRNLVIESIGSVALNTHLGLLGENRYSDEANQLKAALKDFVELGFQLDMMPAIWKYLPVPKFNRLMRSLDTITDFCCTHIEQALQRIEEDVKAGKMSPEMGMEASLLEKLARFDRQTAVIIAMDFLFAGADPTLVSLVGILLSLAKNPDKQARLLEEINQILPAKDSPLTIENMSNLPYLRACIKEGIRLYPIGPGTVRRMPHDVVLSGYRIVAGTDVATAANYQMANMEEYVPRVREFLPERWLRDESNSKLVGDTATPFMYLPFGFGPRACAGKRIVDMMLEIGVARLVRNFEIGFDYPIENAFKSQFFVQPNIPFKFKFVERTA